LEVSVGRAVHPSRRWTNLFHAVVVVPKAEIDRREKEWQKANGKKLKKGSKR
jgi:hypothetical protein